MARPRLTTCDAVELAGRRWLVEHEPKGAVVISHGFTASSDNPELVAVAEALHDHALDVVTYDARGHGGSGGLCTLGDLERHDVAAAVELARQRTDRIVLVGASMGAIAALRHSAADAGLSGTVLVSSPARWVLPRNARSVLAALLTRTPPGRVLASRYLHVELAPRWTNPEPPLSLVAHVRSPLALVHGEGDRFIPPEAAHELYRAAPDPRRLAIVAGMGHAFEPRAVEPVVDAVAWALQESPVSAEG